MTGYTFTPMTEAQRHERMAKMFSGYTFDSLTSTRADYIRSLVNNSDAEDVEFLATTLAAIDSDLRRRALAVAEVEARLAQYAAV